jgi:hypothetical protein
MQFINPVDLPPQAVPAFPPEIATEAAAVLIQPVTAVRTDPAAGR